jgi:hypothetical protein
MAAIGRSWATNVTTLTVGVGPGGQPGRGTFQGNVLEENRNAYQWRRVKCRYMVC